MPKAKADQVIVHRLEFQETERDVLEMIAASITARNVSASIENTTQAVGNLVTPILSASAAGVAAAVGIMAWWELRDQENENNGSYDAAFGSQPGWLGKFLAPLQGPQKDSEGYQRLTQEPPTEAETKANRAQQRATFRASMNQLRVAITTQLMKITN